jgi:hypothetical protein
MNRVSRLASLLLGRTLCEQLDASVFLPSDWKQGPASTESLLELLHTVDRAALRRGDITGSFDRRRFLGNNKDACEASGEPDTANDDCYKRRYEMLTSYYPSHQGLNRMDRSMVLGEYAVEGILEQSLNNLEAALQVIAGPPADIAKPSGKDGLIAEAKQLTEAASQLNRASVASVAILYDTVLNLTDTASNAVTRMKTNVASSYSDLMEKVKNTSAAQVVRAANNTQIMVEDANKALSLSVGVVGRFQTNLSDAAQIATDNTTKQTQQYQTNITRVSVKLSDAEDLLDNTESNLKSRTHQAAQTMADKVGSGAEAVTSAGDTTNSEATKSAQAIQDSLKSQTTGEIASARSDWTGAATDASSQATVLTGKAESRVDALGNAVTEMLSNATASSSQAIQGLQTDIGERTGDALKANQDASKTASALSSNINNEVSDVSAQKNQIISSAESDAANVNGQVTALLQSSASTSDQSLLGIIQGLGSAQAQAQQQQAAAAGASQDLIAHSLDSLGQDGSKVAGSLTSLESSIAMGQSKANQEIQTQFSSTMGAADSAKIQLTGQLDQVSNSLTDSESKLSATAADTAKHLESSLATGSSTAGAQIDQLLSGDVATNAKLMQSILNGSSEFENQADDMRDVLSDLVQAGASVNSGASSAQAALGSSAQSADSTVEDLFGSLGDSDDDTLEKIRAETLSQKQALNHVGTQFSADQGAQMGRIWNEFSSAIAREESRADQNSMKSETAEKANLDKGDQLRNSADALQGNVDSLVAEGKSESELTKSQFGDKLREQTAKDASVVAQLQGLLNQNKGQAMGDIGGFLHGLIDSQNAKISSDTSKQREVLSSMDSSAAKAAADSAKLAVLVDAVLKTSQLSKSGVLDKIISILDSTDSLTGSFSSKIKAIEAQLSEAKSESSSGLADLERSIQAEVVKIPMILTSGAARLQNDFDLTASDLDSNILKLKEKMTTAESDEEREQATQGLMILNKLQAIQQGVKDADRELRKKIQEGAESAQIDSSNIQGAMASVLAVMNTINGDMETSRITVDSNTEAVGKQTATLVNGFGMMIGSNADRLAHTAAQAAVDARFNLNLGEARNKVRLGAATKAVNDTLQVFGRNTEGVSMDETAARKTIDSLKQTTKTSSVALASRINEVLKAVSESASKVASDASEGSSDILTRLAVVRSAVAKFLGLWNEYVVSMNGKLHRFHAKDATYIAEMEADIKAKLGVSESNVNETDTKVSDLRKRIQLSMQDEVEYENLFNSKLDQLKHSLKQFNDDRSARTLHANDIVNEFGNYEVQNIAELKEEIKKLIDEFDDRISTHVVSYDQLPMNNLQGSLLEKRIHAIEREVQDVLTK